MSVVGLHKQVSLRDVNKFLLRRNFADLLRDALSLRNKYEQELVESYEYNEC